MEFEFKPVLNYFDEWQTYDLILVTPSSWQLSNCNLPRILQHPSIFSTNNTATTTLIPSKYTSGALIERFTPYFMPQELSDYSSKIAKYYELMNHTHEFTNLEINEDIQVNPFTDNPQYKYLDEVHTFEINNPDNDGIVCYYLEMGEDSFSWQIINNGDGKYASVNIGVRTYFWRRKSFTNKVILNLGIIEPFSLLFISDNEQLVISLNQQINQKSRIYLWENINDGLANFKQRVLQAIPKLQYYRNWNNELIQIPEEYQKSGFYTANNNYWNSSLITSGQEQEVKTYTNKENQDDYQIIDFSPIELSNDYYEETTLTQDFNQKLQQLLEYQGIIMADSPLIKEIHAALNAGKFAKDDNNIEQPRVANLGYYIERLSRINGISVNSDGSIRSIRNSKAIPMTKESTSLTIPSGYAMGQWGEFKGVNPNGQSGGNAEDVRDGIVYEVRSNTIATTTNGNTGDETATISPGGYVLVENFPQLVHIMMDDFDKALGMQEAGGFSIPNADGTGRFMTYEGLNSLMVEIAFMMSRLSEICSHTHIAGLATQMVVFELLRGLGVPVASKSIAIDIGDQDAYIQYPALTSDAPTVNQQFMWVLTNLLPIIKSVVGLDSQA